ncbi:PPC domain-containing DNA-binding protein [Candidatus Electrothrix sp.]|uniref:PPC domain-containing DNA-binding protein n=1 Tax=Candidatus Electrothrix sp. TaxID=2170559 RepID=UPI004057623F
MEYRTGSIGRVLTIRFDHGEDFLKGLEGILLKEKIQSCWFQVIGALDKAGVVTGPKQPVVPPEPIWQDVDEVSELLGCGSVHMNGDKPKIHLHGALGEHGKTLTGCIRKDSRVYLVLEVIVFELQGIFATRPWDEANGISRLVFS